MTQSTQPPTVHPPHSSSSPATANAADTAIQPARAVSETDNLLESDFSELLQRPEAVALIVVAIAALFWQLYLALIEERESESLLGSQLARRLEVDRSTISRRKSRNDFPTWSQALDPEGISWIYENGAFVPQVSESQPAEISHS